jgi:hypothetical protein
MMTFRRASRLAGLVGVAAVVSTALLAQSSDVPLRNWTVPPYTATGAEGGLTTMADISEPVAFIPIDPCRIADTRGGTFTGQAGGPLLTAQVPRTFQVAGFVPGIPVQCGVPAGAKAASFQFTIVLPSHDGNLIAWPAGPAPQTSVINWTGGIFSLGSGTIVPLSGNSIMVQVNGPTGSTAHLVIDVNGYFTDTYNPSQAFRAIANNPGGPAIFGGNVSATAGSSGVAGIASSVAARNYGVLGNSNSNVNGTAGVKGVQQTEHPNAITQPPAGVLGTSQVYDGVLGITIQGSQGAGVRGIRMSPSTTGIVAAGALGVVNPEEAGSLGGYFTNDVLISGDLVIGTIDTTFGDGDLTTNGSKMFIEPHPTDPTKAIRYVSLEGPESGTYFRGRGRFERGMARIPVPEDFRFVTASEGLTVQITPIGGMATVGVLRMDLNEIVVQSSRNLEFSYLVQGVRASHADFRPIGEAGTRYVPRSEARLREGVRPEIRRRLIANGSYNPDGTVNMETARRLGWDRIWAERETAPAPEPHHTN